MRRIGVASARGQSCQGSLATSCACEVQETLEAQHGLKHLWTITKGSHEPPLELSATDTDSLAELLDSALWVAIVSISTGVDL